RQRQDRRDGNAVARVHAHRVDVLDRADDDEVVRDVAHHLQLEFLPANDRFLDQDLVDGAELEAALDQVAELGAALGDAAADAAERERRADDERELDALLAEVAHERPRLLDRLDDAAVRHVEADLSHRVLEELTILGDLDGLNLRADQLDAVLVEDARV